MRCRKVQRNLSAFLDEELSEKRASQIREHLSGCPGCQREAADISSAWERIGEMGEVHASPYFWMRLDARIALAKERRFSLSRTRVILNRLLVPATAIAASVVGLWIGEALYDVRQQERQDVWEQAATSLHMDALDDLPAQSIASAYIGLVSGEEQ